MPNKDYSHRDVTDKLGIRAGDSIRVVGHIDPNLLTLVREKTGRRMVTPNTLADVILYLPESVREITPTLHKLRHAIQPAGGIWVITAKRGRTSASATAHLNQDKLIPLGLAAGLVDNKICSISNNQSAMRFVIRKADRTDEG